MSENQQEKNEKLTKQEENIDEDDLKIYLEEMKALETDFSDLEDLDMEELQEIQDAISKVKDGIELSEAEVESERLSGGEISVEFSEEKEIKETMIVDFSDIDEIDFDELRDMQAAISSVKQEELQGIPDGISESQPTQEISRELEDRIKQELLKRKEIEEEGITPEKFLDYIKNKREKIWYHALYYIIFNVEDHIASKTLLYDVLKEVTSKSPIDPIPEHQFYFGLGYILRLKLNKKKVVRFLRGGKFKINVNIDNLKELLEIAGEPVSVRPIIKEEEKRKMYKDFLNEDFMDI
jgi:6-pyruvoyl-tetrahydropterin synthase